MTNIRGAVLTTSDSTQPWSESRPIEVRELELQDPGPGELLVRIEAASVCHSDLSVVNGSRPRPLPMLLGHEAAGRVTAVGSEADTALIGCRVVMTFLPRCGRCSACLTDGLLPCEPGSLANGAGTLMNGDRRLTDGTASINHHLGVSGFATHAVVDARSVVAVDDDVPPDIAALLGCAVLTGGGAVVNAGRPADGDTVAVVGLGGVGMAAVLVALAEGHQVVGIDANEHKFPAAIAAGATECMTPQEVMERGRRFPVVVECAGHPRAFETAYAATAPGGRTVTVGLPAPGQLSEISPLSLTAEARTVIGSYLGSAVPSRDIPRYAQLWRDGKLPLESLISATIELDGINEAMDDLATGDALRQVIRF
ncbi:zinc-binding dehydrogenase [Leucobacter aridicollis]|uniref:zinc-binding dehydrogenase n=1 Tax=Leucobacter aridicollis TaxID=283878 RepID=UPI002168CE5A|nr:zinc-binding dehydrogenase [Leucobacter aridicollis]MCS3429389.1 alcohol dehydrogenase [Leucobacter aridicollis]